MLNWRFWEKREIAPSRKGLVGVFESFEGIAMAYFESMENGLPKISAYDYVKFDKRTTSDADFLFKQATLRRFVEANNLQSVDCSYVLQNKDYILTLIDTPNVPKDEMSRAIQWLVRESINFPIEDAVMDSFELPILRARDNMKLSYVAVMRKDLMQDIISFINMTGLHLKSIDIQELTLRNIATRHPENDRGFILIYLFPQGGKFLICKSGNIIITRSFDINLSGITQKTQETDPILEQLALEIQRSLDYASSTFRQTFTNFLILAPTVLNKELMKNFLGKSLGLEVHLLDLTSLGHFEKKMDEAQQAECLMAVGAALREAA